MIPKKNYRGVVSGIIANSITIAIFQIYSTAPFLNAISITIFSAIYCIIAYLMVIIINENKDIITICFQILIWLFISEILSLIISVIVLCLIFIAPKMDLIVDFMGLTAISLLWATESTIYLYRILLVYIFIGFISYYYLLIKMSSKSAQKVKS